MRIEAPTRIRQDDRTRVEARVTFEDADHPARTVFFEAGGPFGDALAAEPELFVLPAFPIAAWVGERRLRVEGALDTTLATGLGQAAALLRTWFGRCGAPTLEPTEGLRSLRPRAEPRTAALFSGGVDAMAMLRENRETLPADHPRSIRAVLYAFGYSRVDRRDGAEDPDVRARYDAQVRRLDALGARVGFSVETVDTNVRLLHPDADCFYDAAYGASYLAPLVGTPRFATDALIASAAEGGRVASPHGSHPLLDVHYATGAVRVHHAQPLLDRLDKVRAIADWEPAFDTLQVCFGHHRPPPGQPNCGTCEKCVRTMLALLVCGALPRFTAFPFDDVTPAMIDAIRIRSSWAYRGMPQVVAGLERLGRDDLLQAIRRQQRYEEASRPMKELLRLRRRLGRRPARTPR